MLDKFLEGKVTRKSPEANAPVVLWQKERNVLGGAGNVTANIKSLGGNPKLFSVIGTDTSGKIIKDLLDKVKISRELVVEKERVTTLKIRIFADDVYMLRLDKEFKMVASLSTRNKLLKKFVANIRSFDAVVLSDYDKGIFSQPFAAKIISSARKYKIPVIADVKPSNALMFKGATIIKPNAKEARKIAGVNDLSAAAKKIGVNLKSSIVLTNGSRGMLLYLKDSREIKLIKGIKIKVKDIVGAGDVVSATLSLALATGATLYDSAVLANRAAAHSVEKHGTSTVSMSEVNNFLSHESIA